MLSHSPAQVEAFFRPMRCAHEMLTARGPVCFPLQACAPLLDPKNFHHADYFGRQRLTLNRSSECLFQRGNGSSAHRRASSLPSAQKKVRAQLAARRPADGGAAKGARRRTASLLAAEADEDVWAQIVRGAAGALPGNKPPGGVSGAPASVAAAPNADAAPEACTENCDL
jgi:hypothetical protein